MITSKWCYKGFVLTDTSGQSVLTLQWWVFCIDNKVDTPSILALCSWDNRAKQQHWIKKCLPARNTLKRGKENVTREPLVERERIILPPLHVKLGLMKQFVKALDKSGGCSITCGFFPELSLEKRKRGFLLVQYYLVHQRPKFYKKRDWYWAFCLVHLHGFD